VIHIVASDIPELLAKVSLAVAGAGCVYLLVSCAAVLAFPVWRQKVRYRPLPVTILKPLHGSEPGLSQRLSSFCRQDYAAPIQVVCGVRRASDPAAETTRGVAKSAGCSHLELVVDPRDHGANPKVSNLANMFLVARHDVLVIADSDIEVRPDYLASLIAELNRPGVGVVTCLYHGVAMSGRWSRHAALAINGHFLPNAVTALSLGLVQPCFGSTIAIRRGILSRIGGLRAFADILADDYAIGEAVRSAGYEVAIPRFSVGHACFHDRLQSLVMHELRTARTLRSIAPIGYRGAIITHPFALALVGILYDKSDALLLAATALACRAVLCRCVECAFGLSRQPYWLIPSRDLLSFVVYLWSLLGWNVVWRGSRYRVVANGSLLSDRRRAQA
jgi:ceramide glucosyltransferase